MALSGAHAGFGIGIVGYRATETRGIKLPPQRAEGPKVDWAARRHAATIDSVTEGGGQVRYYATETAIAAATLAAPLLVGFAAHEAAVVVLNEAGEIVAVEPSAIADSWTDGSHWGVARRER